jgi:glycosyltransferase involved in cell wall biosynthesis
MKARFVTAFHGARDYYEVPFALSQMGLLQAHVSDFYCPDFLRGILPALDIRFSNRFKEGLSSRYVYIDVNSLLRQVFRVGDSFNRTYTACRSLSEKAATLAERFNCDLFMHSHTAYWAFEAIGKRRRFLYQFHPHAASVLELLENDVSKHPEVRYSFDTELDSRPQPLEWLDEWQLADQIVCASTFTKQSLVKLGCAPHRIHVVPYGASVSMADRREGRERGSKCRFIFVGQGVQRKGLHHLLKAWRVFGNKNAELSVVSRRLDAGLHELLDQNNVTHYPGVSPGKLAALYANSDIFVMPSLVEGFGLVYLEALSAGLECIGTTNTGLPDLHLPADMATIIEPGNIEQLVLALEAAFNRWSRRAINRTLIARQAGARTWKQHGDDLRATIRVMLDAGGIEPA